MEQLQADRCGDIEQLVYLRWINACLRYELRNYQPAPGKTTARDLSKTLSPVSEHIAKQLILEYANKEDAEEMDFHQWSNSQASVIGDSLRHKNHMFCRKLMRVLKKKDLRNSSGREDVNLCWLPENGRLRMSPLGSKKLMHRHSVSGFYNHIGSIERDVGGGRRWSCSGSTGGERSELVKYAEALKDSCPSSDFKCYRRSPSLTLF